MNQQILLNIFKRIVDCLLECDRPSPVKAYRQKLIPTQIMFATDKSFVRARHSQSFGISNILLVPCPYLSVAFFFQNGITAVFMYLDHTLISVFLCSFAPTLRARLRRMREILAV